MSLNLVPLIDATTTIKVSSSLDKSVSKKGLTDGSPETCWTSQQGLPQFIQITFKAPVIPLVVHLTFQGGFVGKRCSIQVLPNTISDEAEPQAGAASSGMTVLTTIYPEDVNRKQIFELPPSTTPVDQLKIVFEESSDFFGRITVYDLQIEGTRVANHS